MIALKKLDGKTMHLNEDLIERVEDGADGQSAVYLRDGGHIIVANDPTTVVERVRTEKVAILQRALQGPEAPDTPSYLHEPASSVTRLSRVRGQ